MVMNQINIACKKFILTEASERVDDFISGITLPFGEDSQIKHNTLF